MKRWTIRTDGLVRDEENDFEVGHVWRNREASNWEWRCLLCGRLEILSIRQRHARDDLVEHAKREHSLP
jgi:hypothetical protein